MPSTAAPRASMRNAARRCDARSPFRPRVAVSTAPCTTGLPTVALGLNRDRFPSAYGCDLMRGISASTGTAPGDSGTVRAPLLEFGRFFRARLLAVLDVKTSTVEVVQIDATLARPDVNRKNLVQRHMEEVGSENRREDDSKAGGRTRQGRIPK